MSMETLFVDLHEQHIPQQWPNRHATSFHLDQVMQGWKQEPAAFPTETMDHRCCSSSSPKSSRGPPPSLRIDTMGVNPSSLIGKVLRKVTRSPRHPTLSLHFKDSTIFQIHIEGYHPQASLQGIPKELEMDPSLNHILSAIESRQSKMDLLISDCALVRLTDKAFQKKKKEERWDQNHLGLAFKFAGDPAWHCVWATIVEYDEDVGGCIFRSYDDVYLQPVSLKPPRKARAAGRNRNGTLTGGK